MKMGSPVFSTFSTQMEWKSQRELIWVLMFLMGKIHPKLVIYGLYEI
jgi:hypothetical protein